MTHTTWGRWTLNTTNACLETTIAPSGTNYQVPLIQLNTAAATLNWIFRVQEKTWVTSQDTGDLVDAIVNIFGTGVANGEIGGTIDTKQILTHRYGIIFER